MGTQMNIQQSSYLVLNLPSIITKFHHNNPLSSSKFPSNSTLINNYPKTLLVKPILSSFSNTSSSSTNNQEQKWVHEGTIFECLPNGMFWVTCDNGDKILGYVSGKMRRGFIRILPGDRVKIEVSRYDSSKGRIIYRTRG